MNWQWLHGVAVSTCLATALAACGPNEDNMAELTPSAEIPADSYAWLEEIESPRALAWVREQNQHALAVLENAPDFAAYRDRAHAILAAEDRIAMPDLQGDMVYNFWQDDEHVRGIWRRASLSTYRQGAPDWQVLIDLDALAAQEDENWIWKGANCLAPDYRRCILALSRGGKDATVLREFDIASRQFVDDGFQVAEAKSWFDWYDHDHLMIGTDFDSESRTDAGYPRQVRLWRRGTALADAQPLSKVASDAVGANALSRLSHRRADRMLVDALTFFTARLRHLTEDGRQVPWPLPDDADFKALANGYVVALLRSDWQDGDRLLKAGSLVAYAIDPLLQGQPSAVELVYETQARQAVRDVAAAGQTLYVSLMDNVSGRLLALSRDAVGNWRGDDVDLPADGTIALVSADIDADRVFVLHESFLTPERLYLIDHGNASLIQGLPQRFDPSPYQTRQAFATSKDGTAVPYFIVARKDMAHDGDNPVWLYGYGGFEVALTPTYVEPAIEFWLQAGGVFALANIRGGGEFGPAWHQAARGPGRQRAYDDFAAVAEDLIAQGITRPSRLGISGRSNGGLLTSVQLTQRPDLYNAVIIGVPLTDMMRYDQLLAGASWRDEYGRPDDPQARAWLLRYSPYHRIEADQRYPETLIYTSTQDDRVHPGHARKFAARLLEHGAPVLYYENIEGGHAGVANLAQAAHRQALELVYMQRRLMSSCGKSSETLHPNAGKLSPSASNC